MAQALWMPERRRFLRWTGAGLAVVGAPMVRSQTGTERNRVTVTVAGGLSLANLPLSVALHRGFFGQEGLDVDFVESLDEAQSQQAFLLGGTELVCGPYEQTMRLQARGKPGVAFVMLARVPKVVFGISTRKHATLRALTDFRGQLVGYGGAGTTSELVARQVLSRAGLRPTEVQWQAVADAVTGLHGVRSGQLDAWCNGDPAMTQLEQRSEVRVLSDTRTLRGTAELFGGPMPGLCLYATSAFLQRNPRHAQALANAVVHALRWLQTAGPRDLVRTLPERMFLGDRAVYLAALAKNQEGFSTDGVLAEDGAWTALRHLAANDPEVRLGRIDLSQTWSGSFALRAREQFRL